MSEQSCEVRSQPSLREVSMKKKMMTGRRKKEQEETNLQCVTIDAPISARTFTCLQNKFIVIIITTRCSYICHFMSAGEDAFDVNEPIEFDEVTLSGVSRDHAITQPLVTCGHHLCKCKKKEKKEGGEKKNPT